MNKVRRGIGLLLIIVGLGIILNIAYKKFETSQKQNELLEVFQSQIVESQNDMNEEDKNEDGEEKAEEEKAEDEEKRDPMASVNGVVPIALLEIPSIDLMQAIGDGVTQNVIKYYLGRFPESVMPGEDGNFSVAGHRVSSYADAFVNLHKLKNGDEVIVQTLDGKYTYEVTDNFIVQPEEVYVLDHSDEATITLITCTVESTERVVVTGKLVSEKTD